MSAIKIRQSVENFGSALDRLEEALAVPLDEQMGKALRDAVILRFMFVYELSWKTLRRFLIYDKVPPVDIGTPRDVMSKAFQAYWIQDDHLWLNMADHRNLLVHTYNEDLAKEMYDRVKSAYAPEFRRLYEFLNQKFSDLLTD